MILETERLRLREMEADDYDALYAVLADPDIMQHYPYAFDEARVRGWIERNRERYRIFGFGLWAVCLKQTGEMIGDCGLTMQLIGGVIKPEIGYHIRADMQRKGYAREAARAVRDWAFAHTPFNVIYSYMKYTNEPSARAAVSWGCKQVDEFEDDVNEITKVFAITREEWEALMMKEKNIAYCGLDCEACEARVATRNNDDELRQKVAKEWSELNGVTITPEMINCDGCRADGVKTPYCESLCPIRQCALGRGHETCGPATKSTPARRWA